MTYQSLEEGDKFEGLEVETLNLSSSQIVRRATRINGGLRVINVVTVLVIGENRPKKEVS
ncbi:hypothetical protein CEY16_04195 [Halalkalibacillus sediminis]|uniref:Uncharacterized protein n=1 Tax=Halalkalibacillus sediminis TaxID=2018042 RepID=A0A2I0QX99_9BACI|nr:hypothetical protein [Halalkalibacillus sediminis]PKR78962.1 hypothetical protein CEY16_04195 [Halalkalibacillus sediminis]